MRQLQITYCTNKYIQINKEGFQELPAMIISSLHIRETVGTLIRHRDDI